jgi:hypothetical protein
MHVHTRLAMMTAIGRTPRVGMHHRFRNNAGRTKRICMQYVFACVCAHRCPHLARKLHLHIACQSPATHTPESSRNALLRILLETQLGVEWVGGCVGVWVCVNVFVEMGFPHARGCHRNRGTNQIAKERTGKKVQLMMSIGNLNEEMG